MVSRSLEFSVCREGREHLQSQIVFRVSQIRKHRSIKTIISCGRAANETHDVLDDMCAQKSHGKSYTTVVIYHFHLTWLMRFDFLLLSTLFITRQHIISWVVNRTYVNVNKNSLISTHLLTHNMRCKYETCNYNYKLYSETGRIVVPGIWFNTEGILQLTVASYKVAVDEFQGDNVSTL